MKPWQAIVFALIILLLSFIRILQPVILLIVVGTSIWAAVDSSKIGLYRYKSAIATRPFILFLGLLLLWIVIFPAYLIVRYRIRNGLAQLKDQYKSEAEIAKRERHYIGRLIV